MPMAVLVPKTSTITALHLNTSSIDERTLEHLIEHSKTLVEFSIYFDDPEADHYTDFTEGVGNSSTGVSIPSTVKILSRHHARGMHNLDLNIPIYHAATPSSYFIDGAFEKLKGLRHLTLSSPALIGSYLAHFEDSSEYAADMIPDHNMNPATPVSLTILRSPYQWRYEATQALSLLLLNPEHISEVKNLAFTYYVPATPSKRHGVCCVASLL